MTTTQDIEELRGLAQAATPGIWCHVQRGISRWHGERIEVDLNPICDFAMLQDCCVHEYDRAYENAAYIQAANPAAIIGLIDTIQAQAERIEELELDLDVQAGSIEAVQAVNTRQAERIKVLERESEMRRITLHEAMLEANTLRAELAAIAATEPVANVRTVTVSKFGVNFGNATVSHERITGINAEALNDGRGGVVSNEYMKWLNQSKEQP